ncbi:hypothetical protein BaRGS_00005701 [Batillaria attramentaria]|uniref:TIR domain-containing protein n=1 Tax=Batillaria attramentaria TaxID=370345 RepID=A0ABD0LTV7_9CAEN
MAASLQTVVIVVSVVTATGGILHNTACDIPGCSCRTESGEHDDVSDREDQYDVTCFVTSVAMSDNTISEVPADVSSVSLVCSDASVGSYLTAGLFRHTPNIRHLGLTNCQFYAVSGAVFDDIPKLQSLKISSSHFATDLPADFFRGSPDVTHLSLAQCGLHHLPELCYLKKLESLNVSHQALQSLDDVINGCYPNVTFDELVVLDVTNSSLEALPERLLARTPNLRELYVGFNHLDDVSFRFEHLQLLDAMGQEIHNADFMNLPFVSGLRVLRAAGDGNTTFPVGKIADIVNMTNLHLENFNVNDSVWEVLPSLHNLTHLNLANNTIVNVSVIENNELLELNLTKNQITRVHKENFLNLTKLVDLDLSHNVMEVISSGVFSSLGSLTLLKLSHNRLRLLFSGTFGKLWSLQYLYLDHNNLHTLPMFLLRDVTSLKELDVSSNGLLTLPYMHGLTKLFFFMASNNSLPVLLHNRFKDLHSLEYLFLRSNHLSFVDPAMFETCPLLRAIDLRENRISGLYPFSENHPSLSWIQLDDNLLQDVTFTFTSLPSLETLFMGSNHLTRLTLNMLPQTLRFLWVAWNKIAYVDPLLFVGFPALRVFNIQANSPLLKLTMEQVQVSPTLQPKPSFVISPNLFDCDCDLAYLKVWERHRDTAAHLADNLPIFEHLDWLQCYTYFSSQRVLFVDLTLSDLVCPYREPVCERNCTCCKVGEPGVTQFGPGVCSCVLTCPEECACFHGGSEYVKMYTHVVCGSRNLTEIPDGVPARATHVRLDGNNLTFLPSDSLTHMADCMFLYLNNNQLVTIQPGSFENLHDLIVLDLSHNLLSEIEERTFGTMRSLTELYLQSNQIAYIHPNAFQGLEALSTLRLDHNHLQSIGSLDFFPSVSSLMLADNPWSCDCEFVSSFLKFLYTNSDSIQDYWLLRCFWLDADAFPVKKLESSNRTLASLVDYVAVPSGSGNESSPSPSIHLSQFDYDFLCAESYVLPVVHETRFFDESSHVAAIVTVLSVAVVVVVVGVLLVRKRREVQAWVYDKFGLRLWDKTAQLDRDQETNRKNDGKPHPPLLYDAFVSYSHEDEDFVLHTLAPRLEERGPRLYRLCLHYRDFPVGGFIADTIIESIESSRRTLLLLSDRFLASEWCRFEFQAAHRHVLREGDHRLIIILLSDIAMKTRTYLRADDPWFWEKLYFALPDVPRTQPADREEVSGQGEGQLQPVYINTSLAREEGLEADGGHSQSRVYFSSIDGEEVESQFIAVPASEVESQFSAVRSREVEPQDIADSSTDDREVGSQCVAATSTDDREVESQCIAAPYIDDREVESQCIAATPTDDREVESQCIAAPYIDDREVESQCIAATPTDDRKVGSRCIAAPTREVEAQHIAVPSTVDRQGVEDDHSESHALPVLSTMEETTGGKLSEVTDDPTHDDHS